MIHDALYAVRAAYVEFVRAYRFARYMRAGGNPDNLPF
jgi:hypothetical protein